MKKSLVVLVAFAVLAMMLQGTTLARPPYKTVFDAMYVEKGSAEFKAAAGEAKCDSCHVKGKDKKQRNDYGKALSEFLNKGVADKMKENPDEAKKEIMAALEKAEAKKADGGQTFGELIKAGKLPGSTSK